MGNPICPECQQLLEYNEKIDHYICYNKGLHKQRWFDLIAEQLVTFEEGIILKQIIALYCRECGNYQKVSKSCLEFGQFQGRKSGSDMWFQGFDDWTFSKGDFEVGKPCPKFTKNPLLDPEFFIKI